MQAISQKKSVKIAFVLSVAILMVAVFFFRLGRDALLDYDEAEYAKIELNAIQSNNYLTATLDGQFWFEKPLLQFWVGELFIKTGMPVEWAVRLPSALSGVATVLLVVLIIYEVSGSFYGAIFGALILMTTGAFLLTSRELKLDVPVTAFLIFGLYSFIKGLKNPKWLFWIGVAAGLAVMTKSVVGLLLFPSLLAFALTYWNFKWLKDKWFWLGNLVCLVIVLPWHIYEWLKFGDNFFYHYFIFSVLTRYQSNVINNSVTVWTYFKTFQDTAMPWTVIFLFCLIYLITFWKKINREIRAAMLGSSLIAFGLFLLFSISKTKVVYYLIPIYPWLAVVISLVVVDIFGRLKKEWHKRVFLTFTVILIIFAAHQAIPVGFHRDTVLNIESQFSNVEKPIGLFLASKPIQTIYFDSELYTETIRFYSGKSVVAIDRNNLPARPFYLVLFWNKSQNDPFYQKLLRGSQPVFQGQFEAVFLVR